MTTQNDLLNSGWMFSLAKKTRNIGLPVFLMTLMSMSTSFAATTVTNLGNLNLFDGTYNVYDSPGLGRDVAGSFTTGSDGLSLESVSLLIGGSTDSNGGFSVNLYSDAANAPGTNLGVSFLGAAFPTPEGTFNYTASSPYTLSANTTYWLVATVPHTNSNNGYAWRTTNTLTETGDPGWSIGALATRNVNNGTPESWSVDANNSMGLSIQAVAASPEPSRTLLTSVGLILLICRRKRR